MDEKGRKMTLDEAKKIAWIIGHAGCEEEEDFDKIVGNFNNMFSEFEWKRGDYVMPKRIGDGYIIGYTMIDVVKREGVTP